MFTYGTLSRASTGTDPAGLTFCTINVQTTGLSAARGSSICEIALIRHRVDGTILDEWATLVDPGKQIRNSDYHGITTEMVQGAPTFADIAGTIKAFTSSAIVVAHSAELTEAFLQAENSRAGSLHNLDGQAALCTLVLARAQLDLPSHALGPLHRTMFGHSIGAGEHTALVDARAIVRVLARITQLASEQRSSLRWTGGSVGVAPTSPTLYTRIRPRVEPGRMSWIAHRAWIPSLVERLPAFEHVEALDEVDRELYFDTVRSVLAKGRVSGNSVEPIAKAMMELGLSQKIAAQEHRALFERILSDHESGRPAKNVRLPNLPRIAAELGSTDNPAISLPASATAPGNVKSRVLAGFRIVVLGGGATADRFRSVARDHGATVLSARVRKFDGLWGVVTGSGPDVGSDLIARAQAAGIPVQNPREATARLNAVIEAETARRAQPHPVRDHNADTRRAWRWRELKAPQYWEQYIAPWPDKRSKRAWKALRGPTSVPRAPGPRAAPHRGSTARDSQALYSAVKKGCSTTALTMLFGTAVLTVSAAVALLIKLT